MKCTVDVSIDHIPCARTALYTRATKIRDARYVGTGNPAAETADNTPGVKTPSYSPRTYNSSMFMHSRNPTESNYHVRDVSTSGMFKRRKSLPLESLQSSGAIISGGVVDRDGGDHDWGGRDTRSKIRFAGFKVSLYYTGKIISDTCAHLSICAKIGTSPGPDTSSYVLHYCCIWLCVSHEPEALLAQNSFISWTRGWTMRLSHASNDATAIAWGTTKYG